MARQWFKPQTITRTGQAVQNHFCQSERLDYAFRMSRLDMLKGMCDTPGRYKEVRILCRRLRHTHAAI
jgi:hypothetical protein